ncbi:MAG: transketolase [Firmicutes bacterium]|nr:transketolase [Bacillota bacterium]
MDTKKQSINALRILAAEAIERANSGHPGIALGAAPTLYTLFTEHLQHNPKSPAYFGRDRFILSAGHGSSLLYSAFHLYGYGLTKEDLMCFRSLKSRTPGHPEHGITAGVETSTGPLGQGFANAVGFAVAEKMLAARFNKADAELINHYTYVLCGDGDMQEGITGEAASLAGTWKLGKLICLYDSNDITIEGSTDLAFTEDVGKRHEAYGWQVLRVNNGEDTEEISAAITLAKKETQKPSLIIVKTTIGYGSPKAGSEASHGAALGADALAKTKKALGWTAKPFEVPPDVTAHYKEITANLAAHEKAWNKRFNAYKTKYPEECEQFLTAAKGKAPDLTEIAELWKWPKKDIATRTACETVLNKLSDILPNLVGGSADLGPSNKTLLKGKDDFSHLTPHGSNIRFGVREHAMAAISNGIALHGGFYNYCATFLIFSDYLKHAVRMSALMGLNVTYIFSHDSIGVGEDGPTHQPVEQLLSLRSIPDAKVFRPADGKETAAAFAAALNGKGPTCIITSRQDLPHVDKTSKDALLGGYILLNSEKPVPDCIIMASGSELNLAVKAREILAVQGVDARVVSMPCMELFEAQTQKYKESVLPGSVRARIAVEAGSSLAWHRYTGLDGATVTMDAFGQSAPADILFTIYGFTAEKVAEVAKKTYRACLRKAADLPTGETDENV